MASQAERDHFQYLRKETRLRVERSCVGEMEREVHAILGPVGVEERLSRQVADSLLALEDEQAAVEAHRQQTLTAPTPATWFPFWRKEAKDDNESGLRWMEDVGLTAFLLKFGEGLGKYHESAVLPRLTPEKRRFRMLECTFPPLRSVWGTSSVALYLSCPTFSSTKLQLRSFIPA